MKLKSVTLKCMAKRCGHKQILDHMPEHQPLCEKCHFPMQVHSVEAANK